MRAILSVLVLLFCQKTMAEVKSCVLERTDGVELYGQCLKEKEVYIFRSCIEFTCRVSPDKTKLPPLENKECLKPITDKEFKDLVLKEHSVSELSKVPYCNYGK